MAADAPIDQFARGDTEAMTEAQKRGALLFFGEARCSQCHTVGGDANEMFSDMDFHNVGVPQIVPQFGVGEGNLIMDGPGEDEDFGRERISGKKKDRYKFRTSPIRNVAVQPAFFHNGAFTDLEDALRFHLDPSSALDYDPAETGVNEDLHQLGPIEPVLDSVDKILKTPVELTEQEFADLLEFVRDGLLDTKALPANMCRHVPDRVPSGMPLPFFEGCQQHSVELCHVASGNTDDGEAITVPHTAVANHLAHGDSLLARGDGLNPCGHPTFPVDNDDGEDGGA
ncbi:MAG: cytochrome-c peroxidase [Dehalococcoidia bacterium]